MNKKTKIATGVIALFIFTLLMLASLFMPSISLNPLPNTKAFLEENDFIMNDGIFFISADTLQFIEESVDEQQIDIKSYKRLERMVKRNRGAVVNSVVAMELVLDSNGGTWNALPDSVWRVIQSEGSVAINGTPLETFLTIPEGYKTY